MVEAVKKAVVKKPKAPAVHPTYAVMVGAAIKALKDRTGSSRQAILKYILANYKVDAAKAGVPLRLALKKGVVAGTLKMAKATGKGAGCFKIGEKAEVKKPKKVVKKKPAAKKPKAKKVTKKPAAKKPAAKKPAAKKPAAKKAAKKPAAKKPAAKKPAAKKPAAKKSAAKKPAAKKPAAKKPAAKK